MDAGLPAPARNGPQEFVQRGLPLGASHREAAAQPHKLADSRIQHGKRLPHGAVELRLAGRDGRKAHAERALRPAAQLRRRRRDALLFSKHVFPPLLGETLNRSSAADAGSFSSIHRFGKFVVLRSRWRLCRLTDAACPLRVHKVQLHFPNLALPKNLSPSALVDQFRASLDFSRAHAPLILHAIVGAGLSPPGAAPAHGTGCR